ncbi:MAG TPA: GDSL-type esterase/lipase family protein [Myxococcaceae bacterium]|nr:GDSL-type esterase/lipase family protein [Myxococcaceae bacterium]
MRPTTPLKLILVLATSCLSQKDCSALRSSGKESSLGSSQTKIYQPGFYQVLRGSLISRRATYRFKIPVQRAGERMRVVFQAGQGLLQLHAAGVRRPADSQPTPIKFGGRPGFEAEASQKVGSDPVAISIQRGDEIGIAFEIEGAVAANSFDRFPDGSTEPGSHVFDPPSSASAPFRRGIGLVSIEIEGAGGRAIVAIGDSITEGFITGHDDLRDGWPAVAQAMLGLPVVTAAVSGQGVDEALKSLEGDVSSIGGITDCVVLLGTNDLADHPDTYIATRLETLGHRLRSSCQVWIGTILPKEWTPRGSYPLVEQRRQGVNDWLKKSNARVIDFDSALRDPASPNRLMPGAGADGIHLSKRGHQLVARKLVEALGIPAGTPPNGDFAGRAALAHE